MLTDALLDLLRNLISWFVSGMPQWNNAMQTGEFQHLMQWLRTCDLIVPVHETVLGLTMYASLVYGVVAIKWTIKIVDWVADVIP